jgi:hypothetical protein
VAPDIDPFSMMREPHVRKLAAELTRALDASIEDARRSDPSAHPDASTTGSGAAHVAQALHNGAGGSMRVGAKNASEPGSSTGK